MAKSKFSTLSLAVGIFAVALSTSVVAAPSAKAAAKGKQVEFTAPAGGAVTVSDRELNTFAFPSPISRVLFPAGSPVVGEPIYLADGSQVMLQFAKTDTPVQVVVELEDNSVHTIRVLPKPIQGVVHTIGNARKGAGARSMAASAEIPAGASSRADQRASDIQLLKLIVMGEVPEDFESVDLPAPTKFDKFAVVPLQGWSDGASRRAYVFSLVAASGQTALVAPPQFYRPGITAVMLDGDVVDAEHQPLLYVLEDLNDE